MPNPCFCGCSLKTASLIIAVLDMVMASFCGIIFTIYGGMAIGTAVDENRDNPNYGASVGIVSAIVIVILLVCIGKFYLGLVLKRGSDQEDLRKCRVWFIVSIVLLVIGIIGTTTRVVQGKHFYDIFGNLIGAAYECFCLWIVYEFMQELKSGTVFDSNGGGVVYSNKV